MPFIGTQPDVGGYSVLDALTASATASYTLQKDSANFSPSSANQLLVSLNGVIQKPGSSFTVSGSTLTFSSALSSSDSIDFILAMGEPLLIGTPSDATITASKLASNIGISTTGNIATTGSGTLTSAGLITASAGIDINGTELILDADADTSITADTDDRIDFKVGGNDEMVLSTSALRPGSDTSIGLGTSSIKFANLYVDNIKVDGNTISSEDTNGDINLTPNGSGQVVLDGFAFPVNGAGSSGQFLRQDGSGNLEFATVTSSFTLSADSGSDDTFSTGGTLTFVGTNPINTAVSDDQITISVTDASTSAKGVASFATANFEVNSGEVTTKNITLGGSTLTNGSTTSDLTGLNSLGVDDLTLNGSTISTSAGNNNIVLSPHGTGVVRVPSGYKDRSQFDANTLVTKEYVDAIKQNLDIKDSVHLASTANVSLTAGSSGLEAGDTIDGVALQAGDRVLLKNQTDASENGIYVAVASGGTPARSTDANSSDKVTSGLFVFVEEGTANGDQGYVLTTNSSITLDDTDLTFTQFSGAGQITAGNGIAKSANTISADVDNVTIALASGDINIKGITQTRKGDLLLGATTNDAGYVRLPVGSTDQILTVQGGTLAYTSTIDGGTFSS